MSFNRKPIIAMAVCLMVFGISMAALAQDQADDPAPVEAKQLLGDRALPPDPASDDPAADGLANDNMGAASYEMPAQASETVTETPYSSSSFTVGAPEPDSTAQQDAKSRARWPDRRPPSYRPGDRGTYCQVPQNGQCRSCAVDCPSDRIAHCTGGSRGIFNKPDSTICATEAKCECK